MITMVEGANDALARVQRQLPDDFPGRTWGTHSAFVREQAKRFLSDLAGGLEAR
jgi:hypothetical protein